MKYVSVVVLLFITCISHAQDAAKPNTTNQSSTTIFDNLLVDGQWNTAIYGKCINAEAAAWLVSGLKDRGRDVTTKRILKHIERQNITPESKETLKNLHLKIIDLQFLPEHMKKSRNEFTNFISHQCQLPKKGECDGVISAATTVANLKEEGTLMKDIRQMTFKMEGATKRNSRRMLIMAFRDEHVDKNAQEFIRYITDEWCKLTQRTRDNLYRTYRAPDTANAAEVLAKHHDGEGKDKCKTIINAASFAGYLKDKGFSSKEVREKLLEDESINSENQELYFLMADLAFSPQHTHKDEYAFAGDIDQFCETP